MTEVLPYKSVLPSTPRLVTRRAGSRAWAEMPVQLWWKTALVVTVVGVLVAYGEVRDALNKRRLLRSGVPVKALIVEVAQTTRNGFAVIRADNVPVKLRWDDPTSKQSQTVETVLPPGPGYAKVGEMLDLRVDPANPANWAEAGDVLPWWRVLAVPLFMLLPILVLLLAVALWQRWRVLEVWKNGKRADGVVVGCSHAAIAPRSRVCSFTYADGRDRRVFKLLYPASHGVLKKGDPLELIALPEAPHRVLAAELYLNAARPAGEGAN